MVFLPSTEMNHGRIQKATSINLRKAVPKESIMVLIANYRDSNRCAETLMSLYGNATFPDRVTIGVYDQIYTAEGEQTCKETYCQKVGKENCEKKDIRFESIDASEAKGPTVARYETEKLIHDEEFCLAIDSHLVFVQGWDTDLVHMVKQTENPRAIITVYPTPTDRWHVKSTDIDIMCKAQIESSEVDAMIRYAGSYSIKRPNTPILQTQLAGGFNFGSCQQSKDIRNDPYTAFLFHGEEYSRASRLWTSG